MTSRCRAVFATYVEDAYDASGMQDVEEPLDPDSAAGGDLDDVELDQSERIVINVSGLRVETRLKVL